MKLEGSYTIAAPREAVWQRLMDHASLCRALPGCERIVPAADGVYSVVLKLGIASVKGTYTGRVEILEPVPPERYRMTVEGNGAGGFLKGEATITLADTGESTLVSYSGDAQVGGLIASVGQRLIQGAARQIVNQFFEAFAKQFTSTT